MNQFERLHLYASMFITISGICATFHPQWLNHFMILMTGYLVGGCFVDTGSLFVHHIICISMLLFVLIYPKRELQSAVVCVINCEYSSVFYNGWPILNDLIERYRPDLANTDLTKHGKTLFSAGFLVTFVKFRVWDIGTKFILNTDAYSWHTAAFGNNIFMHTYYNLDLFAFYLLNLYWFLIIIKKTVKPLLRDFNTYLWCEYLAQYSSVLSFVGALIVYYRSGEFDISAIIHCNGLVIFVYGCWVYHRALYLKIKHEGELIDCLECGEQLKVDVGCSNMNAFSAITSSFLYYYPILPMLTLAKLASLFLWCCSSYNWSVSYIDNLRMQGHQFRCDTVAPERYRLHTLMHFPTFIGSGYYVLIQIIIGSNYSEIMPTFYLILLMYLAKLYIIRIEPFYKLSHVGMHIVIAYHHYWIATQNVKLKHAFE